MLVDKKTVHYDQITTNIKALIDGQTDPIAIMSTVVCELHNGISYFHWTGFYRVTSHQSLHVGPYQGGHGCSYIPFNKGICGQAATSKSTIMIGNVNLHSNHIACSNSTLSEIVVPLFDQHRNLLAVLDVDSDFADAFDETDKYYLENICALISQQLNEP